MKPDTSLAGKVRVLMGVEPPKLWAVILHPSWCLYPAPQPLQTDDLVSIRHNLLLAWCSSCSPREAREQEGCRKLLLKQEGSENYFTKFSAKKKGKILPLKILIPRHSLSSPQKSRSETEEDWVKLPVLLWIICAA